MARQTRNIYVTGNADLDRILADIALRLDTLEGLRADLAAGFLKLDENKQISTDEILIIYDDDGEILHWIGRDNLLGASGGTV